MNLDEIHKKGTRTLMILTNHLLVNHEEDEAYLDEPELLNMLNKRGSLS